MRQAELALGTAESTAKARSSGKSWGMCSKHGDTSKAHATIPPGCHGLIALAAMVDALPLPYEIL